LESIKNRGLKIYSEGMIFFMLLYGASCLNRTISLKNSIIVFVHFSGII